jgi:tripartite-type tricarboxylate transporter receptor subunit TctC
MSRRRILLAGVAALATPLLSRAQTTPDEWPSKPVTVIVPFPPGGGTDVIARAVTSQLQIRLKQPFLLDNKPGASGMIGSELGMKATPDGYTLTLGVTNTHAINSTFFRHLRYDPVKDFQAVALLATGPHIAVVNNDVPATNMREFIQYAKDRQGKLSYGSYGNGSTSHLITELLKSQSGIDILHVPYKGIPPALTDLIGGQIAFLITTTGAAMPLVKAGKMRVIAVIDTQRLPALPDVPTMNEQGFKMADYTFWYGLFAPAATPQPLVERIAREVQRALGTPEVKAAFDTFGVHAAAMTPQEFSAFVRAEKVRWGRLVELSGARGD